MIFMSQSGLTDRAREAAWDAWYVKHLHIMASVPGISSAQRFKTATPGFPPSLAMYSVASPNVFIDPYYLKIRGMGEWQALVDRQYYKRNLFEGLPRAPQVADNHCMLVADRDETQGRVAGLEFTWLKCVGIDRSTPYRGIVVVAAAPPHVPADVAVYEPVTPRIAGTAR